MIYIMMHYIFGPTNIMLYRDWKRENKSVLSLNLMAAGTHYRVALDNLADNRIPII